MGLAPRRNSCDRLGCMDLSPKANMVSDRPANLDADDYQAIEEAVMETARGRWFLAEFARRQRSSEMAELRELLLRLEARLPATALTATPETTMAAVLREEVVEAPPAPVVPPLMLRDLPRLSGLTLEIIDAMPIMERLALFA